MATDLKVRHCDTSCLSGRLGKYIYMHFERQKDADIEREKPRNVDLDTFGKRERELGSERESKKNRDRKKEILRVINNKK